MKYHLFLWVYLCAFIAHAQYYNTGTESAGVKWRQIKTDKFTVIYPQEVDSIAQRYTWLLDKSYKTVANPLLTGLSRIPVIIHPYNVRSNGVVVWAPKRMELFTTPPTDGYPQMWDKQLVLHETRHVAQMDKLHSGLFKYLYYFIGEQSEGLGSGIYLFYWFLEGDATVSETAGSETGRGRQAAFLMPIKTILLSEKRFSWDTWLNGSYKYNIPNAYQMGYVFSAYAYRQAGEHIFGHMLDYITHHPLKIPPSSYGLKKYGGFDVPDLFEQSFDFVKQQWLEEESLKSFNDNIQQLAFPEKETYRSYRSVTPIDSGKILAVRLDMQKPGRLVTVDNTGKEDFIKYIGPVNSPLRKQGDRVYWTVTVPHERWEQVSFSILQCYDISGNRIHSLTHRTRYFSPAPSPDSQWVAVIENTAKGEHFIVLLETEKYTPVQRIALSPGIVPKELCWSEDGASIYSTLLSDEGLCVQEYNRAQKKWNVLLAPSYTEINHLNTYEEYLLFESGYNGTNNIYALHAPSKSVFQVTNVRFGAFDPAISIDRSKLLFANYSLQGYTIAALPLDRTTWQETAFNAPKRYELADTVSALTPFSIDTLQVPATPTYKSKRYGHLSHLFNVHSWTPFYYNPDALMSAALDKDIFQYIGLGTTLLSQNALGTMTSRLGYKYADRFHSGHFAFTYRGFYPVIDFGIDLNERHRQMYAFDTINNRLIRHTYMPHQPLVNLFLRLYAPLNLTRGAWQTALIPQAEYHFSNDEHFSRRDLKYQYLQYMRVGFTFYRQLPLASRDIFPRWGYSFRLLHYFPVFGNNVYSVTSVQASCYAPGLLANHGIALTAGYQLQHQKTELRYSTFTPLNFPRGYTTESSEELITATFDYSFPIAYPDFNISWIIYFTRFRMNVFCDYARVKNPSAMQLNIVNGQYHVTKTLAAQNFVSAGADFVADYHLFRFGLPISTGIRYAHPLTSDTSPSVSLLFNISL